LLDPKELFGSRSSEFISNSTFVRGLKNTHTIGFFETVLLVESTELQRKWRLREQISERGAFQGAEAGLRMLQIQRVFSRQIRNREPFATGWWRRERNWKLTFSSASQGNPA
jgi:hypothetical protein